MVSMLDTSIAIPINPETGKPKFEFVADWLALDFCNTINYAGVNQNERLKTYADLVLWGRLAGTLDGAQAASLAAWGDQQPAAARDVLVRARHLRDVIHRMTIDNAAGRAPLDADVRDFNALLAPILAHLRLARGGSGFELDWDSEEPAPDRMLWAVARSAMQLFTEYDWRHMGQCSGDGCSWLYFDGSRNHSRRWCSTQHCGNRMKMRRHYRRSRGIG